MTTRAALALSSLLVLAACDWNHPPRAPEPRIHSRFKPYTAVRPEPSTDVALQFYVGDAPGIDAAGAKLMGHVHITAKSDVSEQDIAAHAARRAAEVGATHLVLTDEDDAEKVVVDRGPSTSSGCFTIQGNVVCSSQSRPAETHTETTRKRTFALFAIPVEAWGLLPRALWPKPLGPKTAPKPSSP